MAIFERRYIFQTIFGTLNFEFGIIYGIYIQTPPNRRQDQLRMGRLGSPWGDLAEG